MKYTKALCLTRRAIPPTLSRSENKAAEEGTSYHQKLGWGFAAVEDGTPWL